MDYVRHKADSTVNHELYSELLQQKLAEYGVEAEHTYSMEERGFATGVIGKSKRVSSKDGYQKKRVTSVFQDGN